MKLILYFTLFVFNIQVNDFYLINFNSNHNHAPIGTAPKRYFSNGKIGLISRNNIYDHNYKNNLLYKDNANHINSKILRSNGESNKLFMNSAKNDRTKSYKTHPVEESFTSKLSINTKNTIGGAIGSPKTNFTRKLNVKENYHLSKESVLPNTKTTNQKKQKMIKYDINNLNDFETKEQMIYKIVNQLLNNSIRDIKNSVKTNVETYSPSVNKFLLYERTVMCSGKTKCKEGSNFTSIKLTKENETNFINPSLLMKTPNKSPTINSKNIQYVTTPNLGTNENNINVYFHPIMHLFQEYIDNITQGILKNLNEQPSNHESNSDLSINESSSLTKTYKKIIDINKSRNKLQNILRKNFDLKPKINHRRKNFHLEGKFNNPLYKGLATPKNKSIINNKVSAKMVKQKPGLVLNHQSKHQINRGHRRLKALKPKNSTSHSDTKLQSRIRNSKIRINQSSGGKLKHVIQAKHLMYFNKTHNWTSKHNSTSTSHRSKTIIRVTLFKHPFWRKPFFRAAERRFSHLNGKDTLQHTLTMPTHLSYSSPYRWTNTINRNNMHKRQRSENHKPDTVDQIYNRHKAYQILMGLHRHVRQANKNMSDIDVYKKNFTAIKGNKTETNLTVRGVPSSWHGNTLTLSTVLTIAAGVVLCCCALTALIICLCLWRYPKLGIGACDKPGLSSASEERMKLIGPVASCYHARLEGLDTQPTISMLDLANRVNAIRVRTKDECCCCPMYQSCEKEPPYIIKADQISNPDQDRFNNMNEASTDYNSAQRRMTNTARHQSLTPDSTHSGMRNNNESSSLR